jgi:hypothetical protein
VKASSWKIRARIDLHILTRPARDLGGAATSRRSAAG